MAWADFTWTAIPFSVANANSYIRDNDRWVAGFSSGPKPHGVAYLTSPVGLTTTTFTVIALDTAERDRGGGFVGGGFVCPSGGAGMYRFSGLTYTAAGQGNKELRIIRNSDENDYCGVQNQYGVATPAVSGLNACGEFEIAVGDTVDIALYMDDPSSFNCVYARLGWELIGVAA